MNNAMLMNIITGPIGRLLLMIVFMTMFSLWLGGINQWYLQTVDACNINGERVDRLVVGEGASAEVEGSWQVITGTTAEGAPVPASGANSLSHTTAYLVAEAGTGCGIGDADAANAGFVATHKYYTPTGLEVSVLATAQTNGNISGGEWSEESSALEAGGLGPVIPTLFQAAILAPPVLLLTVLGSVAGDFAKRAGGSPIIAMVIMGVIVLLFATILNTMIPFLTDAYEAIDGNRFRAMDEGIGSLSTVIGNFFGVSLVAGALSVAWTLFNSVRTSGNAITQSGSRGGGRRGGGMM